MIVQSAPTEDSMIDISFTVQRDDYKQNIDLKGQEIKDAIAKKKEFKGAFKEISHE